MLLFRRQIISFICNASTVGEISIVYQNFIVKVEVLGNYDQKPHYLITIFHVVVVSNRIFNNDKKMYIL